MYQTEHGLSLDQIRTSIEHLKRLFHLEWTKAAFDAGPPNVALTVLYGGKGLWPFQNLMWLSRVAAGVIRVPGLHRPMRELASEKSWAALMELEVASWFAEKSWEVEFLKPGEGRCPDLRVQKNGLLTAIECKRFGPEQWEGWAEELSFAVSRGIDRSQQAGAPSFDVVFESRLSDLVWDDEPIRAAIREQLAERIGAAVHEATSSVPPLSIAIPGIAEIRLLPDNEGNGLRGIGGIEISPQAKMRRIIRNGILEAAEQLRAHGPGAVVIKSDFTPPKELVDVALLGLNRADHSLLRSIAVVAITPSLGSPAVVWQNPALEQHQASGLLATTFREILLA